jgi:hypothetical protein
MARVKAEPLPEQRAPCGHQMCMLGATALSTSLEMHKECLLIGSTRQAGEAGRLNAA